MQSFKNKLEFFQEKESTEVSLHKFVLQKMSSQMAAERRQVMINRVGAGLLKKPAAQVPCISKTLYETPVSLIKFCKHKKRLQIFSLTSASKQILPTSILLSLCASYVCLSFEICRRSIHYHRF
jgi:hypothetical protein